MSIVELRSDGEPYMLAAELVATPNGLTILIAEGFEVAAGSAVDGREISLEGREIHIQIRERAT